MSWLKVTASSTPIVLEQHTLAAHNSFIENVTKIPQTMLYQPKTVFPCHRKIHEDGFWVNLWLLAIGIGSWWILPFLPLVVGVIVSSGFWLSQTRSRPTRNPILLPHTGCPTRSLAWSPTRCPPQFPAWSPTWSPTLLPTLNTISHSVSHRVFHHTVSHSITYTVYH